jgi:aromatic-L-amino-acid decarboxylase
MVPLAVISTFGTTGSTALDPIQAINKISKKYGLWHHLDAALGGNAWILPEIRELASGYDLVDSLVFNPHKWLFTNFDCTAYYVKDPQSLVRTFSITPEYLKTDFDQQVNNYRDWGIQLGRRFRALKLWFVIRSFGVEGMQAKLRDHLKYTRWFLEQLEQHPDFEVLAPVPLNTICFRYNPPGFPASELNHLNQRILERINQEGAIFITHTVLRGRYVLRMVIGQTEVTMPDVEKAWEILQKHCNESVQHF